MVNEQKERIPVKIQVLTVIRQMDEEEQTIMPISGVFYKENDAYYLQYKEIQEAGEIRTVWKSSARELLLLRNGAITMRMHFLKNNNRSLANVDTGAGKFVFETALISFEENYQVENALLGEIRFEYDLFSQSELVGSYEVTLKIEEDKEA